MIDVKNLNFSYKEGMPILKNINFEVNEGEIMGFLGPNGSGKSTTQKILTGLLTDYEGVVNVAGKEMKNHNTQIYNDIGVLFEMPYLYSSLSAIDNLKYFGSFYPKERLRDIDDVLDLVNLKKEYRKKPVKRYSKGMRQRVSFARALLSNPKILFLDEPLSGLDPAGAILFKKIIRDEKAKGTTIFITTHNMYVADELCDRIAFVIDGKIEALDTPKNLKTSGNENLVQVEYLQKGEEKEIILETKEIENGFNFDYEVIKSVHTKELSMEDVFVKVTGRGLKE